MKKAIKIILFCVYLFFSHSLLAQIDTSPIFTNPVADKFTATWSGSLSRNIKFKMPDSLNCYKGTGLFIFKVKSNGKVEFVDFKGHLPDFVIKDVKRAIIETCCWQPELKNGEKVDSKLFYFPFSLIYYEGDENKCSEKEASINNHEETEVIWTLVRLSSSLYKQGDGEKYLPFIEMPNGYILSATRFETFHPKE